MRSLLFLTTVLPALALAAPLPVIAAAPPDYERDIKPVLEQHCFNCHGADKQKGSLRLDVKSSVLKGGDSGKPAVVPGNAERSHLLKLITSTDASEMMPPKGDRLTPQETALLGRWIETGAHWIEKPAPDEAIAVVAETEISAAVRAFWSFISPKRVEPPVVRNSHWPRGQIDRFVLAKLESRGIQPSGEATREVLIRRLSFDLTGLPPTPADVDAFLSDQSADAYERLVDRLLASPRFGERMASLWLPLARYAEDQAHQVGTDTKYFYPHAWKYRAWVIDAFNRDLPYDRFIAYQIAADQVGEATPDDLAALGFLGLGPKYYNRGRLDVMADEWEDRVDTVTRTTLGLTVACARCHDHKFDPISARDYHAIAGVFAGTKMVNKTPQGVVQKEDLKAEEVDAAALHVVEDGEPRDLNLFIRGNVERKGPVVPRRFLAILSPSKPEPFKQGSGRKELALAIADANNPLTARVMANRVWGMLFGKPIVTTPSNFGRSGQLPSHPELLDDLAISLMKDRWSIKSLVRQIVTSATYRQSAQANPHGIAADPANELLWRMNRRRLTVEQWRDSILFASGRLDLAGGKSTDPDDPASVRRTVYARISRLKLNDLLMQFDYPDANVHAEKRSVTTTPMQKLFMLNSLFVTEQAKALAKRLSVDAPQSDEAKVRRAYQLLFARQPDADEIEMASEFLKKPNVGSLSRWEQYAQILLASNEALYVD